LLDFLIFEMGPLCVRTSYIPPKTLKGKLLTTL